MMTFKQYRPKGKIFVSVIRPGVRVSGSWSSSSMSLARCRRRENN